MCDEASVKAAVQELPKLQDAPRFTWLYKRARLREHILNSSDFDDFLKWSTICESFFVGTTGVTRKMHNALEPRYKAVIHDTGVGNPDPYHSSSGTYITQAYYLQKWEQHTGFKIEDLNVIVEFGGGYGVMALLARRLGFTGAYTIIDLIEPSLLQEYYLCKNEVTDIVFQTGLHNDACDLLIACCSLSEVGYKVRDTFLNELVWSHNLIVYQPEFYGESNEAYFKSRFPRSAEIDCGLCRHKMRLL